MKVTVYRGTKEIGGTFIEIKTDKTKILLDAGYPLFLNGNPIEEKIARQPAEKLLELGVLPSIQGLYSWESKVDFDGVILSHAHIDHYGLTKYIHPDVPVYASMGTKILMDITRIFLKPAEDFSNYKIFKMYEPFTVGDIIIKPFLMDHSAFDAAAFEISSQGKVVIYTGDFRGHGRKSVCLDRFIDNAAKDADLLLTEGTMMGRKDEMVLTEKALEDEIVEKVRDVKGPVLFQSSGQNIDRIVGFYRAALRLRKIFVVDVYTANVLYELRQLGNNIPFPSDEYSNIKVFYPYRMTQKIFNEIGEEYAKRFSSFHIPKETLKAKQNDVVMMVRPSMLKDLEKCDLQNGIFVYSLWEGYRDSKYQKDFEEYLSKQGFEIVSFHTSGHASVSDIRKVIDKLRPKKIAPIHTMVPEGFKDLEGDMIFLDDGVGIEV